MKLEQISTLLNNTIVPNYLGQETTIATDLSNVVDLGQAIADIDADTVKDFAKAFVVGVARNYFDDRMYERVDYGLFNDFREYGGVLQRVKAKLIDAEDSPIWTLENGQNYFDGTYHEVETDVKIYSKDTIFMVVNSIPTEMWKQSFMSADGVSSLIAMIESRVESSVNIKLNALAKSIFQQMIVSASEDRNIHLLTLYNTLAGTSLTAGEALNNAPFLRWSAQQIVRLRDMITVYNDKYNDGTIETFTPKADTRVTLLTEFATSIQFNMQSDTFNKDMVEIGKFNTIPFWQNQSKDLLPSLGVTAEVKTTDGENESTVSGVVGIIHDRMSGGMTARLEKTTADYIPKGDFTNYFTHIGTSRFVDTRNSAIVLSLT